MIVKSIKAADFLSFEEFELSNLDAACYVIVGPNGAGKTNLVRALRMVGDVLNVGSTPGRQRWKKAHRQGAEANEFCVEVGIELAEQWEKRLITIFIQAVLEAAPEGVLTRTHKRPVPNQAVEEYHAWLDREVESSKLESLFASKIVVSHIKEPADRWDVSWQFENEGTEYVWILEGAHRTPGIERRTGMKVGAETRKPHEFISMYIEESGEDVFSEHFELGHMLPDEGHRVSELEVSYSGGWPNAPATLEFAEYMNVDLRSSGRSYRLMQVLADIWNTSLLLTENVRGKPRLSYSAPELNQPVPNQMLSSGSSIPLHMFQLKNGDFEDRQEYRHVQEVFHDLMNENVDVSVDRTEEEGQAPESTRLRVEPVIARAEGDIPIELSGAGAWESLVLSVCLCRPKKTVLVLDEPALNLHPSLQRRLLSLMKKELPQGFIITHSPYLLPTEDEAGIRRVIRLFKEEGNTRYARLENEYKPNLSSKKVAALLKELRSSPEFGAMLFANGVLLVEGETELGAFSVWFTESQAAQERGSPLDLNLSLISVDSQNNFQKYVEFADRFHVPWAIICDGPAVADGWLLARLGLEGDGEDETDDFEKAREQASRVGIFTLASNGTEEFEDHPVVKAKLQEAKKEAGRSKARKGRYIAQVTECPPDIDSIYAEVLDHLELRKTAGSGVVSQGGDSIASL